MAKSQVQGQPSSEKPGTKARRIQAEMLFFSRALSGMQAPGRGKKKASK